jgi:succinate dehydrogenase / fumarate reductase flavoprotein subunit/fumarate reductase flavoprotein subunit
VKIDGGCRCNIESLFVSGEDAGGVHGANRLGGNGVADSIVFGGRAGDAITDYIAKATMPNHSESQAKEIAAHWQTILDRKSGENPFKLRDQLEVVMWRKVGVVRNGDDMRAAIPEIQSIRQRSANIDGSGSTIYNAKWNEAINVINLATIAETIARSALMREESRGAHYRQDFPEKDAKWLKNINCAPAGEDMNFWTTDVKFTRLPAPELAEIGGMGASPMR